ncbi:MAG: dihydroneopterin aldolase [Ferruginibacter sp.]|nr:dihydroneopterin aldolase [Ferruginibacter sp.]
MLTLHLNRLQFHAYHGLYELEKSSGNTFEVDVEVTVDVQEKITRLHQTLNYATVYEVIKHRMQQPTALLETVAQEITELIRNIDPRIRSINITIKKLSPPIENFQGTVGVSIKTDY